MVRSKYLFRVATREEVHSFMSLLGQEGTMVYGLLWLCTPSLCIVARGQSMARLHVLYSLAVKSTVAPHCAKG